MTDSTRTPQRPHAGEARTSDDVLVSGRPAEVPYFSQWASDALELDAILADPPRVLLQEPDWAASGAGSREEYAGWAWNVCGMACLKMVLAARFGTAVPILELARECTRYGGYTVDAETGVIRGLIYAPFVRYVRESFGLEAEVVTDLAAREIAALMHRAQFFIASVHSSIRWPTRAPGARGGHLVLVYAAADEAITFHNPAGDDASTRAGVRLATAVFEQFFAGRGIAILR